MGRHVLGCRVDILGTNCNIYCIDDDDDVGRHVLGCRVDILGTNCKRRTEQKTHLIGRSRVGNDCGGTRLKTIQQLCNME